MKRKKKKKKDSTLKIDKILRLDDEYMKPGIYRHYVNTACVDLRVILNDPKGKKPFLIPISAKFREEKSKGIKNFSFVELFGDLDKSLRNKSIHDKFEIIYCFITNEILSHENRNELQEKYQVIVIAQQELNFFCPIFANAFPRAIAIQKSEEKKIEKEEIEKRIKTNVYPSKVQI